MRATAILGLGSSSRALKLFQKDLSTTWKTGLPASPVETDAILIFGGDGTIHRHLSHLVDLGLPVLVVPCGSGNDFARALTIRSVRDSLAAWRKFSTGGKNLRTIDLGVIQPLNSVEPAKSVYFCCVGGVGLDGEITRRANRLPRWLRANGGYALSLPFALLGHTPHIMKISEVNSTQSGFLIERSNRPTVLAAFANTPVYGGGMKIAPRAQLDDGLLDVCVVGAVARSRLLRLFPSVYFGRHLDVPEVEYFQSGRLRIETEIPLYVFADGEYICRTPMEVSTAPRKLTVVVP
ncbi:MAG TPA: diacylglycerol kinase family protein [Candidatus Angelobacter sp.]|jgi:diacylglycerol kinase (ATP)|nr:diacylglycerol kinase family protein [Candidatus Angelobacter sp.]